MSGVNQCRDYCFSIEAQFPTSEDHDQVREMFEKEKAENFTKNNFEIKWDWSRESNFRYFVNAKYNFYSNNWIEVNWQNKIKNISKGVK